MSKYIKPILIQTYFKRNYILIEQVNSNKSSSSLKIILQNTQTLQLLTRITKTESTYLSN
jgi:hypothetical protein